MKSRKGNSVLDISKTEKKCRHFFVALLLLLLSIAVNLQAQTKPGGTVYEVELWLKADSLKDTPTADGVNASSWVDRSGKNRNFGQNNQANPAYNTLPVYNYNGMNYHPAVSFNSVSGSSDIQNRGRKLIYNGFPTEQNKSYYTFWVSKLNSFSVTGTSKATVFTLNGEYTDNSNNGWSRTPAISGRIWHETRATSYHHQNGKTYGIGTVIQPNTSVNNQSQYHNGVANTGVLSGRTMAEGNYGNATAVIGKSNLATDDYFFGDIQEIIVLSTGVGQTIDPVQLAKIHTYLALKYGQTMNDGFTYTSSTNVSLFDPSYSFSGLYFNKNIFGIGKDSGSGLNQRQSSSVDDQAIAVFVGDELATLNSQNTGTLPDNTYLLLGCNRLGSTFTPCSHDWNQAFASVNGVSGATPTRQWTVMSGRWRAQLTGAANITVNIKSLLENQEVDYVFVSSDPSFPPNNTHLYEIDDVTKVATGVHLQNGYYVALVGDPAAPGGVHQNLKMWLSADDYSSFEIQNGSEGNEVRAWTDKVQGIRFYYTTSSDATHPPLYETTDPQTNFHPGVRFQYLNPSGSANDRLRFLVADKGPMSVANPNNYTIFTVLYSDFSASRDRTYFLTYSTSADLNSDIAPAFGLEGKDAGVVGRYRQYSVGYSIEGDGSTPLYNLGATSLLSYEVRSEKSGSGNGRVIFSADGVSETLTHSDIGNNGANLQLHSAGKAILGSGYAANRTTNGLMAEMIAYEGVLTPEEKNKIYSALGLKYGITIDANKNSINGNFDYTMSNGGVVWPGTTAPYNAYHHQVAAVIRDNASQINNLQARSSDAGSVVKMGVGSSFSNLTGMANDKEYIVWGDNNAALSNTNIIASIPAACGGLTSRWNRIWLVNKSTQDGIARDVQIAISESAIPYSLLDQVFLLIANEPGKLTSNNWDRAIQGFYRDGEFHFSYQFPEGESYFALGAIVNKGGCIDCAFDGLKTGNFVNWSSSHTINMGGVAVTTNVTTEGAVTTTQRRNSFNNSLEVSRRQTNKGGKVKINMGIHIPGNVNSVTPAVPSFTIYDIDGSSSLYEKVSVYGMCATGRVDALLSHVSNPQEATFGITNYIAQARTDKGVTYSNVKGHARVTFPRAVTSIVIEYETSGAATGSQSIGIGPLSLRCALPPPPVNEDGLSFTKTVSSYEQSLCEDVVYAFTIKNTNCASKIVSAFTDVLPEGMKWVAGSVGLDSYIDNGTVVNEVDQSYGGTGNLSISNLQLEGDSEITFLATATFDPGASAGVYGNRAFLSYNRVVNGANVLVDFGSYAWDEAAFAWQDDFTYINAQLGSQQDFVTTTGHAVPSEYTEDIEDEITISIQNPNANNISNMQLHVTYNAGFTFVNGSYSSTIPGTIITPVSGESAFDVTGFTLPGDNVSYTFKFKLKSPTEANLQYKYDSDGEKIIEYGDSIKADLEVDYEFTTDSSIDMCIIRSLGKANGIIVAPYRTGPYFIPVNKNIRSPFKNFH